MALFVLVNMKMLEDAVLSSDSPLLLSAQETRLKLGVSERGLRYLLKRGLPYIIVGRRRKFPSYEIEPWVKEQANKCTNSTNAPARRTGMFRSVPKGIGFDEAYTRVTAKQRSF